MSKFLEEFLKPNNNNSENVRIFKEYCISSTKEATYYYLTKKSKKIIETFDKLETDKKRILLAGKVQSGKTLAFLSCISEAFNNEYKIIIILTSLDEVLQNQTIERVEKAFKINRDNHISDISLHKSKELSNASDSIQMLVNQLRSSKKIVITSLKGPTQLKNILNLFKAPELKKYKVLIIDDESDLASNTMINSTKESAALSSIHSLISMIPFCAYLSVTATPYVQLLAWDKQKLLPLKVFTIEPGEGYMGLESFFENKNLIEIIPEEFNNPEKFRESDLFWNIILKYWITVANITARGFMTKLVTTSMLFHINVKVSNHAKLIEYINQWINNTRTVFKNEGDFSFVDFKKKILKMKNEELNHLDWTINGEPTSDDLIFAALKKIITEKTEVLSVNGLTSSDTKKWEEIYAIF